MNKDKTINQKHSGTGDNIAGDKVINVRLDKIALKLNEYIDFLKYKAEEINEDILGNKGDIEK